MWIVTAASSWRRTRYERERNHFYRNIVVCNLIFVSVTAESTTCLFPVLSANVFRNLQTAIECYYAIPKTY